MRTPCSSELPSMYTCSCHKQPRLRGPCAILRILMLHGNDISTHKCLPCPEEETHVHASLLLRVVCSAFVSPLWGSQADLRCIKLGPPSSYSALESHICWKDPSDASIDPPAHGKAFTKTKYCSVVSSVSMVIGLIGIINDL